jgi:hypothetical protein
MKNERRIARKARKVAVRSLSKGNKLRVVGSEKAGFKLAIVRNEAIVEIGLPFSKQKDAIAHGEAHYNQKASKIVAKKAANIAEAA